MADGAAGNWITVTVVVALLEHPVEGLNTVTVYAWLLIGLTDTVCPAIEPGFQT